MKILLVADEPCKSIWDYYDGKSLKAYDLILSAGDLPPQYLSFLVTFSNCPLLYVHGNHDGVYDRQPPEGCICVDDTVYVHDGVRIAGLGGSLLYNGNPYQYTEKQMKKRALRLGMKIRRTKGIDILLTHAPARGFGDRDDPAHRGFDTFTDLLDRYRPAYMVHGHVHMNYGYRIPRTLERGATTVINAYERYVLDYKAPALNHGGIK